MADIKEGDKQGDPTEITLKSHECAMVFSRDLALPVILIPSGDPDEDVEEHVLTCVKLALALGDPICQERMNVLMEEGIEAKSVSEEEAAEILIKDENEG